jgi:2-methylisocitrate lyase-like PEP mutase family enzyme
MTKAQERAEAFAYLHRAETPLLLPNPWDIGSAKLFASLGFRALATTSGGFAATLGRPDGAVTRDEALAHASAIVNATDLPVSADLENGFADDPAAVAETVRRARQTGLAGCSIEDYSGTATDDIYDLGLATDRIAAAAEAAHAGESAFVLTARSENHIRGRANLADTIKRLQQYQEAGADVVYAPGVSASDDIRSIVESVDVPVNVLALPNLPPITELRELGVARVSIGGAFFYAAFGAAADAAKEFLDQGTFGFWDLAGRGLQATHRTLS